jgi:hypothetical protein
MLTTNSSSGGRNFDAADRASCLGTMLDFEPTYTELLTCLEMAGDTRKLPEQLY